MRTIEQKRANKEIGSSLEAEIEIKTSSKNIKLLEGLDLSEYFITSAAKATEKSNDKGENERYRGYFQGSEPAV